MSVAWQPHAAYTSTPSAEYTLTDTRGEPWTFKVFSDITTVLVVSPTCYTRRPCTLKYHRVFMRDTLAQLPQGVVSEMLAEARVFDHEYPHVVKPYTHDDGMGNQFEMGIAIRFTNEHWSVVMERVDARRLWGLLSSAR